MAPDQLWQSLASINIQLSPPLLYEVGFEPAWNVLSEQFLDKYEFIADIRGTQVSLQVSLENIQRRMGRAAMIRVLIADDHTIVREGIRHLLEEEADLTVIAEADNGRMAVQLAEQLSPDVVLMDMSMPEMNGIEAARKIVALSGKSRVLMLSMHSDRRFVSQALKAGAKGYLLKDCASDELVKAILSVANDEVYICSKIVDVIIDDYIKRVPGDHSVTDVELTPREREILQLIAEGKNTKEIAFMIDVSPKTVESHRRHIMEKLKLFSVAELTKYALREGMTTLE